MITTMIKNTIQEKWEALSEGDKNVYNNFARDNQTILTIGDGLDVHGCWECGYKPKNLGDFEFHLSSTHGIPREVFETTIRSIPITYNSKVVSDFIDLIEKTEHGKD